MADAAEKVCGRCKAALPRSAFGRSKSRPDGLQSYCKTCSSAYQRDAYRRDPGYFLARSKANYEANREEILAEYRRKRAADPEYRARKNERAKQWLAANPEAPSAAHARRSSSLTDGYLAAQMGLRKSAAEPLIDAYRHYLKIRRLLKEAAK